MGSDVNAVSNSDAARRTDSLTILRARGRRLAKLIRPDGSIEGYDRARTFDMATRPVADLGELDDVLAELVSRPDCAVVRGEPIGLLHRVRRLVHPDPKTGEAPTLREVPRRWLALDVEGIARPGDTPAADLAACALVALATLPTAFADAACIVAATGSHGFLPDLRLRLWWWCSRPMTGMELKRWLRATPADQSVFSAAQLIYTAAPVLDARVADPLSIRSVRLPGRAELQCPSAVALAPPSRPPARQVAICGKDGASRYAQAALRGAASRILTADKRHPTILAEARGLARLVRAGMLAEGDMQRTLHAAAADRDKPQEEVDAIVAWALANPSGANVPEVGRG